MLIHSFEQRVDKSAGADGCWIWTGPKKYDGYAIFRHRHAHRIAYESHVGPIPDGMQVDHLCHNRACCNPCHLRVVTQKQNQENRAGAARNNRSGARGVSRNGTRWQAEVRHNGKKVYVGRFDTVAEASAAAQAKRVELFTHNDLDRVAA